MATQRRVRFLVVTAVTLLLAGVVWDRFLIEGNSMIRLYGRVIDQNGRGIPGVKVHAEVWTYDFLSVPVFFVKGADAHLEPVTLTTDAGGDFQLLRWRAHSVIIKAIEKDGYSEPQSGPSIFIHENWRTPRHPFPDNPASPIVYTMLPALPVTQPTAKGGWPNK